MDVEINKYHGYVQIVIDGYKNAFSIYRLNSEMTKDLIKEEFRRRVYSFRPTFMDCMIYKTRLTLVYCKKGESSTQN